MTFEDREKLARLKEKQLRLEDALASLRDELRDLERRVSNPISVPPPIPLPISHSAPKTEIPVAPVAPVPEPVRESVSQVIQAAPVPVPIPFEPVALVPKEEPAAVPRLADFTIPIAVDPNDAPKMETPVAAKTSTPEEAATPVPASGPGLEFQFGRWLARIGVVFALITLVLFSTLAYNSFYHYLGPWSKLGALSLVSVALLVAGLEIERRSSQLLVYGRTLAGGGLACLYYTLYGATYVKPLQVIGSPLLGGLILLVWSAGVLFLAERKKSELLSIFAIALAYFSSSITPVGPFTMVANLLLSITAIVFLVRNAWTGLSYLCLAGTYFGLLRQFITYDPMSDYWFVLNSVVTRLGGMVK